FFTSPAMAKSTASFSNCALMPASAAVLRDQSAPGNVCADDPRSVASSANAASVPIRIRWMTIALSAVHADDSTAQPVPEGFQAAAPPLYTLGNIGGTEVMNGAQVVAEILKREGTEFLSCYPRNPVIEPCAALDIRPILCRQERVGVGLA